MNSIEETIRIFTPDQRKLIQRAGLSEKEIATALRAMRERTPVAFFTKANERYAICQNTVLYQREQRNKMLTNRKTLKKTTKSLKAIAQDSRESEADRIEAQRSLEENEKCICKIDRAVAEMDENIERLQAEMDKERAGAQETLRNLDAMVAMGMCMIHAMDIFFDEFDELMTEVGYCTASLPELFKQFSELFGQLQSDLIKTNFYVMHKSKQIWGYEAQTKTHIAIADRMEEFKELFAKFCSQALTDLQNGEA